jgi:hypothetical protein
MKEHGNGGGRHPPRSPKFFVGRHFSWVARTAVKIARELSLTDEQFLRLIEVLVQELRETNENFNRDIFVSHVRVAAYSIKQNESVLSQLD